MLFRRQCCSPCKDILQVIVLCCCSSYYWFNPLAYIFVYINFSPLLPSPPTRLSFPTPFFYCSGHCWASLCPPHPPPPLYFFSLYLSFPVTPLSYGPGLCPPSQRPLCFGSSTCTPPPTSTSCWTGRTWRWESWWRRMTSCRSARPKTVGCSSSSPRTTACKSWSASSPQSLLLTWRRGAALSECSQWWLTQEMKP